MVPRCEAESELNKETFSFSVSYPDFSIVSSLESNLSVTDSSSVTIFGDNLGLAVASCLDRQTQTTAMNTQWSSFTSLKSRQQPWEIPACV
mmetsp:Transcript_61929/g.146641  ORF Transcript_61929/g.146641 Transcript_61929/m.146641 type:complete len:91 (+) Transcript_61929:511-783(+)